jgi:ketosteroid isomerase-like protein
VSQGNVEVVQRFESLMGELLANASTLEQDDESSRAGFEQVLELLDPDVVFRPPPAMPYGGDHIGHDGFLKMCEGVAKAWNFDGADGFEFEFLDAGEDRVVLLASFTPVSRETGRPVPIRMVEVITVRDGKIIELVPYYWDTVPIVAATDGVKTL